MIKIFAFLIAVTPVVTDAQNLADAPDGQPTEVFASMLRQEIAPGKAQIAHPQRQQLAVVVGAAESGSCGSGGSGSSGSSCDGGDCSGLDFGGACDSGSGGCSGAAIAGCAVAGGVVGYLIYRRLKNRRNPSPDSLGMSGLSAGTAAFIDGLAAHFDVFVGSEAHASSDVVLVVNETTARTTRGGGIGASERSLRVRAMDASGGALALSDGPLPSAEVLLPINERLRVAGEEIARRLSRQ